MRLCIFHVIGPVIVLLMMRRSISPVSPLRFRDLLYSASKSQYGWNIAKAMLILKTNNQRALLTVKGAAVAEWLSSWLAEQEDRASIPGLATWIFRDWLSPASKSRYGWKIAKSTLILKTKQNNQLLTVNSIELGNTIWFEHENDYIFVTVKNSYIVWLGWFRIYVALQLFQSHRNLEAGDIQSLKSAARPGIETRLMCRKPSF